jgi:hypothetical protein
MAIIQSFRELRVYQLAKTEAKRIFLLTKKFPPEERFSLTDQIRRSSRAVNAMIAELDAAWQHIGAMLNKMIQQSDDFCRTARVPKTSDKN